MKGIVDERNQYTVNEKREKKEQMCRRINVGVWFKTDVLYRSDHERIFFLLYKYHMYNCIIKTVLYISFSKLCNKTMIFYCCWGRIIMWECVCKIIDAVLMLILAK